MLGKTKHKCGWIKKEDSFYSHATSKDALRLTASPR